jgi:SAM-dependent methyltransferase
VSDDYYDGGLILRWARGEPAATPAPLAVRSRWYRRIIAETFERCLPGGNRRLLSLGSGTGRMEAVLAARGFALVASDVSPDALRLCRQAGLVAMPCDITAPPALPGRFDGLYADGLLGHFDGRRLAAIWRNCRALCDGHFVLSNDLSEVDTKSDYTVHGNEAARFVRPPAGAFARSALRTGLWREVWSRVLLYRRPGRGLRRRELLVLRAVTDERTDDKGAR